MAIVVVLLAFVLWPLAVAAQTAGDTITIAAGEHYGAGALHRWLFGTEYRALWTTPIRAPVLDLRTFGGGLTPTTAGGGRQTKSLRFRGANGQLYGFRSIDKDPGVLPEIFTGTFVERLVQDQISSAHPAGPAITAPLMEAAGILHTDPILVVLPDDPGLGEFRQRFRGTLGFIEERAITEQARPFAGAREILDADGLLPRVRASAADRVDARSLLNARLFDVFIGDWDRHDGQWNFVRFEDGATRRWRALPEDRDQAFARFDGLMLGIARLAAPLLVNFGEKYPGMFGLNWNGREIDRFLLSGLEKAVWDSTAAAFQRRMTDAVIERAAGAMPPEYRPLDSARLVVALKRRRDDLPSAAEEFYRLLTRQSDVHGTDAADVAMVDRRDDGAVLVTLGPDAGTPYLSRRFVPSETSEIRVYLYGGDDRLVVRGGASPITLRVVAGGGADEIVDSSNTGGVRVYSADGDRVAGSVPVDRRPWTHPEGWAPDRAVPPRDWGARWQPVVWLSYAPDVGAFLGAGTFRTGYGFRHVPFKSWLQLRGGYATMARTGRGDLGATLFRSNSRLRFQLAARASGIEVLNFHGFGNEAPAPGPREFYRVAHSQFMLAPSIVIPLGDRADWTIGPFAKYSSTETNPTRYLFTLLPLYGAGKFGQTGLRTEFRLDTRDVPAAARSGVLLRAQGSVSPDLWDVARTFGAVEGEVAAYLSAGQGTVVPTLALRAGGRKVWGPYPFQESAFLGGRSTVRLGRENRFAGDAAVFGNAELRLQLAEIFLLLPGHFGVFGLTDAGRVFYDADPAGADTWHTAVGGGFWISLLTRASTASVALVRGDQRRLGVYVGGGMAF